MARKITAPDRVVLLLSVIPYLMEHGETGLAQLAEAFDVPPRLMRELIEFLGTAGVPGETGAYQHEDLFDIDWDALELHDLVRLTQVVAIDEVPRFSPAEHAALVAGLQALAPLLPPEEAEHARSAGAKLGTVGEAVAISAEAEVADRRIAIITRAIDEAKRISFAYQDLRGDRSERTVEPLALTQSAGGWYLRGYCLERDAERTFLVDGMRRLRARPDAAERRRVGRVVATSIGPHETTIVATVRVREHSLARVSAFAPRVRGAAEPGWARAEVELSHAAAACRIVQAAPGDVIVEAPASAREAVRAWADRALAGYRA